MINLSILKNKKLKKFIKIFSYLYEFSIYVKKKNNNLKKSKIIFYSYLILNFFFKIIYFKIKKKYFFILITIYFKNFILKKKKKILYKNIFIKLKRKQLICYYKKKNLIKFVNLKKKNVIKNIFQKKIFYKKSIIKRFFFTKIKIFINYGFIIIKKKKNWIQYESPYWIYFCKKKIKFFLKFFVLKKKKKYLKRYLNLNLFFKNYKKINYTNLFFLKNNFLIKNFFLKKYIFVNKLNFLNSIKKNKKNCYNINYNIYKNKIYINLISKNICFSKNLKNIFFFFIFNNINCEFINYNKKKFFFVIDKNINCVGFFKFLKYCKTKIFEFSIKKKSKFKKKIRFSILIKIVFLNFLNYLFNNNKLIIIKEKKYNKYLKSGIINLIVKINEIKIFFLKKMYYIFNININL
ncbi:hypothetical protein CRP_088 [Candidatus Carsonella ruddii PV]|uniref:Uncharacterized protein n=1 Tax=Carsonella ruddii (strain PV) TaxID=387662 RepID=Q05FQ2_CARRP|nr:hypothetical protein [Candidatus Carsonella ruddii]BAF35119.1 hypothetical protein CRP_088 [Candidatus Carsonella ruddii PV]